MWPEESHSGSWGTLTQLYLDPWHLPQKRFFRTSQSKAKWMTLLTEQKDDTFEESLCERACVRPCERNADVLRGCCVWYFEASSFATNLKFVRESRALLLVTEFCSWRGALSVHWVPAVWERRTGRSRTPPGRCLTYVQVPNGGT